MPSWWPKTSSKDVKKKGGKESFFDTLQRKFKSPADAKPIGKSGGSRRRNDDPISELGSQSQAVSRSPSPSKTVVRCQSFSDRPLAQPLPLPSLHSAVSVPAKVRQEKGLRSSLFPPLPKPSCIRSRPAPDQDGDMVTASVSSESSTDSDDPACSSRRSPQATDSDQPLQNIPRSPMNEEQCVSPGLLNSREMKIPANKYTSPTSSRRRQLGGHVPHLQVQCHGAFFSAPDSSMSSPSRSPMRMFGTEQLVNSTFWAGKTYQDVSFLSSGHGSSPGSGYNSGHNSMAGDASGQLFLQPSRGSPEYSPIPSPKMNSPGPGSRVHSGAVTPIHPRATATASESQANWQDDGKQQSHRLPLPPILTSIPSPFCHMNSAAASPSVPRSPGWSDNQIIPGSRWKKGKLLGRGTFGHVFVGYNSESGKMCAMKEVTLFSDDAKSMECAKQLMQEISLLSRLSHPNIVQYFGSETVGDKLYIYLEYVSGGSIYKILQEYGQLGEVAIRSYTQQILSGLAYLHSKNTVHRDIKGANILVDPNGRVKLADFGMAKHIRGQTGPLSFKGSPYWMAPEVIKNSNGCSLAVDIWSLGCTVLEMATTKPPWSQFEGVAAMFKIGNSKDLPAIPDHLSDEGKDFVRLCLQRNPQHRPTASQLLDHPFVKKIASLERPVVPQEPLDPPVASSGRKPANLSHARNFCAADPERLVVHSSRFSKANLASSDLNMWRNVSCPVSPVSSPILRPRSPQGFYGMMSPSPISSPKTTSGSSTPLTGAIPHAPSKQFHQLKETCSCIPPPVPVNGGYASQQMHAHGPPEIPHHHRGVAARHHGVSARYYGQSVLADRVSRQLLKHPAKANPSVDLNPVRSGGG